MGKKNTPPPPPDYSPLISQSLEQSRLQFGLQQQMFDWAKQAYADNKVISDQVSSQFLQAQRFNQANAEKDRLRWEKEFRPLEDEYVQRARNYASQERQSLEAGRASASVAQQMETARAAAAQKLESFGIDPSSTRYGALDLAFRAQQGAATAAASNQARLATEAMGNAMMGNAINLGRQSLGQGLGMQSLANQSGSGAINTSLATTMSGAQTMGTPAQWGALGMQGLGQAGNFMNMGYGNQLAAWKADQDQSSGWGSVLGLGAGLLGASKNSIFGAMLGFEDGGSVPQTPGGAIPMAASPTGGQAVDDVPARLTAGEFVVPKDVTAWKGEEFFQKLIDQSRKAKGDAPAKPQAGAALPQSPTFVSSPQQGGALPLR